MVKKLIIWVNKHTTEVAIGTVIIGLFWIIFGPLLLTKLSFFSFPKDVDTGKIGDTIGGITAPVIGLISSVLLFLTIIKQIEANKLQEKANNSLVSVENFKFVSNDISLINDALVKYNFMGVSGQIAHEKFGNYFKNCKTEIFKLSTIKLKNKELLFEIEKYNLMLNKFNKPIQLIKGLNISNEYKNILVCDLQNTYTLNILQGYNYLSSKLFIEELDDNNDIEYGIKKYLKQNLFIQSELSKLKIEYP